MTVFEYLTKDLDMSEAQCEAIMQLADACGMKPMFEAGLGALQRLKQKRQELATKKTEKQNARADFAKDDTLRQFDHDEESDDGSLFDTDERVNLSELFDSHADEQYRQSNGITGSFSSGWQFGDEGDEGFNNVQSDVTYRDKKRAEEKTAVSDRKFVASSIMQFIIALGKLAALNKNDTIKLAADCVEQLDQPNKDNTTGRTDLGQIDELDEVQSGQFDSLCEKIRSIIDRIYSTPNLDKRTTLTNLIEDYVVENPDSPFTTVLAAAKRDPLEMSSVTNDAKSLSSDENQEIWDKIINAYQDDNSAAPLPANRKAGYMSYDDIQKARRKMWVNQSLRQKNTTTA